MKLNQFIYFPGGDDEIINASDTGDTGNPDKDAPKKPMGFFQKIKAALQDWSNQDQADQDYDDTRV